MLCVEVGNLVQTACLELLAALPVSTEVSTTVAFTVIPVMTFALPLSILVPTKSLGENAADEQADEQTRRNQLRAQALDELAAESGLTKREREVLAYLDAGRNAEHIAKTLYIAHSTAKSHIAHIYQKMGLNSQQRLMDEVEGRIRRIDHESDQQDSPS